MAASSSSSVGQRKNKILQYKTTLIYIFDNKDLKDFSDKDFIIKNLINYSFLGFNSVQKQFNKTNLDQKSLKFWLKNDSNSSQIIIRNKTDENGDEYNLVIIKKTFFMPQISPDEKTEQEKINDLFINFLLNEKHDVYFYLFRYTENISAFKTDNKFTTWNNLISSDINPRGGTIDFLEILKNNEKEFIENFFLIGEKLSKSRRDSSIRENFYQITKKFQSSNEKNIFYIFLYSIEFDQTGEQKLNINLPLEIKKNVAMINRHTMFFFILNENNEQMFDLFNEFYKNEQYFVSHSNNFDLVENNRQLIERLAKKNIEFRNLNEQFNDLNLRTTKLKGKYDRLKQNYNSLESENRYLKTRIDDLELRIQFHLQEVEDLNSQKSELENNDALFNERIRELNSNHHELIQMVSDIKQNLQDEKRKNDNSEQQIQELRELLEIEKQKNQAYERENLGASLIDALDLEERAAADASDIVDLDSSIEKIRSKRDEIAEIASKKQAEFDELNEANITLRSENQEMKSMNDNLKELNASLQEREQAASETNIQLMNEIDQLNVEIKNLQEKIDVLQEKLNTCEKEKEMLNSGEIDELIIASESSNDDKIIGSETIKTFKTPNIYVNNNNQIPLNPKLDFENTPLPSKSVSRQLFANTENINVNDLISKEFKQDSKIFGQFIESNHQQVNDQLILNQMMIEQFF